MAQRALGALDRWHLDLVEGHEELFQVAIAQIDLDNPARPADHVGGDFRGMAAATTVGLAHHVQRVISGLHFSPTSALAESIGVAQQYPGVYDYSRKSKQEQLDPMVGERLAAMLADQELAKLQAAAEPPGRTRAPVVSYDEAVIPTRCRATLLLNDLQGASPQRQRKIAPLIISIADDSTRPAQQLPCIDKRRRLPSA
jgi:hypothetical protein